MPTSNLFKLDEGYSIEKNSLMKTLEEFLDLENANQESLVKIQQYKSQLETKYNEIKFQINHIFEII